MEHAAEVIAGAAQCQQYTNDSHMDCGYMCPS